MTRTLIVIILLALLASASWAANIETDDPDPVPSPTETVYIPGPAGAPGATGPPGPPPSPEQIVEALKLYDKLREKGFKMPDNFPKLVEESKRIIKGFLNPDGTISYHWEKDITGARASQFIGRLLKLIDGIEAKDEALQKDLEQLRADLTQLQISLGRVDKALLSRIVDLENDRSTTKTREVFMAFFAFIMSSLLCFYIVQKNSKIF